MQLRLLLSVASLFSLVACGSDPAPAPAPEPDPDPPVITVIDECTIDFDCDEYQVCNTDSPPDRVCECAPTYADIGDGCDFFKAPLDSEFSTHAAWISSDPASARIIRDDLGDIDLGIATLNLDGICGLESFSQSFAMPPRERSQAFVANLNVRCLASEFASCEIPAAIQTGEGWNFPTTNQQRNIYETKRFCLGESAYNGEVTFGLSPAFESRTCGARDEAALEFDHFSIEPAVTDECPAAGEVFNGTVNTDDHWKFTTRGSGTAKGDEGAIELGTSTRCSSAEASTLVSVPLNDTLAGAAIEFLNAGDGATLEVRLAGRAITTVSAGSGKISRVCVPDWAKGTVQPLEFVLPEVHGSGNCSLQFARYASINNISVVSESRCGDSNQELDGGFEPPPAGNASVWALKDNGVNGDTATAEISIDAETARSGIASFRGTTTNRCNEAVASRDFIVPPASGTSGPAVTGFVAAAPGLPGAAGLRFRLDQFSEQEAVAEKGDGYSEVTLCIPTKYVGRPLEIEAFVRGRSNGCGREGPYSAHIDDISIGTSENCPVE